MTIPSVNQSDLRAGVKVQSPEAMVGYGQALASLLPTDTTLALHGDLGVGKTTLVRGLAQAWGITETLTSPTFNLYCLYHGDRQLIHMDAYRLNQAHDFESLMLDDFMESPYCLAIEWPERIADALPQPCWHLHFSILRPGCHFLQLKNK
jgi:tRNA threonylcarbamoyladenosine biosynthesis protein TsaE